MNLLSNNGAKTSAPESNVKEKVLNQQIQSLRSIHQQSCQAFDKVVVILKKMINYKADHQNEQRSEVEIKKAFISNLSALEEIFLSITEDLQSDEQLYKFTVRFRDSEKKIQNQVFKRMMKNYQDFKDHLNGNIHTLEKHIQLLESNGYHIYSQMIKPNNVISSLKKSNLEKYLTSLAFMETIFQIIKKKMNSEELCERIHIKMIVSNGKIKIEECLKILKQIFWKEQLHQMIMIKEIGKSKMAFQKQSHKIKVTEEAIRKNTISLQHAITQMNICTQNASLQKRDLITYLKNIKENVDKVCIATPHLYNTVKDRSKSCNPIITRSHSGKENKAMWKCEKNGGMQKILGSDFLQESMEI